jgi:glycosyltransferase involved in cell wall biosynthesis
MKIGIFSNQFASAQGHGIARYSKELVASLLQLNYLKITPIAAWSDYKAKELDEVQAQTGLRLLKTGRKITPALWTYFGFPSLEQILRQEFDLVHVLSLGYSTVIKGPWIVTIHDIGPLTHPEYFSENPPWLMKKALKQAVNKAKGFVAVSAYTADELISYVKKEFNVNIENRVRVIHEGVSESFFSPPVEPNNRFKENIPNVFFLCAGKISPRKNTIRVLEAITNPQLENANLVLVGGDGWDHEQVKHKVKELRLNDRVHFLGYVSDDELKYLYRHCLAFVYPSLFEGFGLTVLEAMACGAPVISSNTTSIPEVAGDAALLIDPVSSEAISEAMLCILHENELREDLVLKGQQRAREMNWTKAAQYTMHYYLEVLNY